MPLFINMKTKKIYLENGFLNMPYIIENSLPFLVVIGGRAIGKTYGGLKYFIDNDAHYMYLRRTQTQIDTVVSKKLNPMNALNRDYGYTYRAFPVPNGSYYLFAETYIDSKGREIPADGTERGVACALSTFANLRGYSGEDLDYILYDEFVKEKNQADIKGEAEAFFNLCETVMRNRELKGQKPCKVILLSNSTDVANPIFIELGIVSSVMKMQQTGVTVKDFPERALTVVLPKDSPISLEKKSTALYKLTQNTEFQLSAIENDFVNNRPTSILSRPLVEYKAIVWVGEICVYKHKAEKRYYVSWHKSGSPEKYGTSEKELAIFRRKWKRLAMAVYDQRIDYEDYTCELLFDKYLENCYY